MKPFDDYEISGCREDHHHYVERVDDDDEDGPTFWTLYGLRDGIAQAIADLPTREAAEELFFSITGKQFPPSRKFGTLASAGNKLNGSGLNALKSHLPIVIEVRGGTVQEVSNVPPGYEFVIRDYDNEPQLGSEV